MSQDVDSAADDGALIASRDGAILRLTLDRPSLRNWLSHSMIDAFVAELSDAATDDELRAILIRGAGEDFCSGADWVAANNSGEQRPAVRSGLPSRCIDSETRLYLPMPFFWVGGFGSACFRRWRPAPRW